MDHSRCITCAHLSWWATGPETIDLGRVGFRTIDVDRGADGKGFGLVVNGAPVFCRGVCWTPLDLASLAADTADYRAALEQLRDAGMNMVRVGGTMTYEADAFHDLCDELGILVWQDFMFANMDYPSEDEACSARTVTLEARAGARGLQSRPSLAVLCGSSEVEQQAAMLGLPAARRSSPLFDELLPALVRAMAPGAPWLPSTPTGGDAAVPGRIAASVPLLRRGRVPPAVRRCAARGRAVRRRVPRVFQHPRHRDGRPRSRRGRGARTSPALEGRRATRCRSGAGISRTSVITIWRLLFGVDPSELRARDLERYLALGRVATGEAMLADVRRVAAPGVVLSRRARLVRARSPTGRGMGRRRLDGAAQGRRTGI